MGQHESSLLHNIPIAVIIPPFEATDTPVDSPSYSAPPLKQQHQLSNQADPLKVVFVGRLSFEKCPGILLRAASLFVSRIQQRNVLHNLLEHKPHCRRSIEKSVLFKRTSCACPTHEQPRIDVHFVGSGKLRPFLESFAEGAGLTDMVTFHGQLSHQHMVEILSGSDNRDGVNSSFDAVVNTIYVGETFGYVHLYIWCEFFG